MKKLDEHSIIKIFQRGLGKNNCVSEDVEVFNLDKIKIIAKTDTLVESTDIPSKMKLSDAARKSIVACVSDFASKGVKPKYGMISVNLPKTISRMKINEIVSGFRKACNEYNISILATDINPIFLKKAEEAVFTKNSFNNKLTTFFLVITFLMQFPGPGFTPSQISKQNIKFGIFEAYPLFFLNTPIFWNNCGRFSPPPTSKK